MTASAGLADSPRAQILAHAELEVTVTDARGRRIALRKPGALAQFRIIETVGESAANPTYMSMVLPLIFVVSIDAKAIAQPTTKTELEALIERLDEAGIDAVMRGVAENFSRNEPEADKAAIKKIATSSAMKECLWLMRHGIDFDLAFGLDEITRAAWCIIVTEQQGAEFNWQRMEFEEPK